ncbi:MAG TPA: substrate binding domain-containing protein, partial [Gemmatimonadaceae bacterium]|nr:substrate binding domain-containing protein [Gemmatimonadaceae bacterium]
DVAAAESLAQHRQVQPSGRLRVTMPSDIGNLVLAPMLAEFVLKYPAVTLEVDLSSRFVDLIAENFDVAVRMGELRDDATLAARRIASFTSGLYAAPSYVARRGVPAEPEALMEHDALRVLARTGDPQVWTLVRGEARWEGIPPGRATANSPELLMRMALGGAGIALIHDPFAVPYLERGELVQVLSDWSTPPVAASAVFPGRRLMPTHARAFVEALVAKFAGQECQALELKTKQIKARSREKQPLKSPRQVSPA